MTFSELYETADADMRQWLDERAAIREYDGNVTRREAESATAREWLAMRPQSHPASVPQPHPPHPPTAD